MNNFEGPAGVPPEFVSHTHEKVESGKEKLTLPVTEAELRAECAGDDHCERALEDFLDYSTRYAADVWNMKTMMQERIEHGETQDWQDRYSKADRERSQLHNALIDSIAILSRALLRAERDNEWVRSLMPTGELSRPACGKFAIMLTYSRYVNAIGNDPQSE